MKFHYKFFFAVLIISIFSSCNNKKTNNTEIKFFQIDSNGIMNYIVSKDKKSYVFVDKKDILRKENKNYVSLKGMEFRINGKIVSDPNLRLVELEPSDTMHFVHYLWHVRNGRRIKPLVVKNNDYKCMELLEYESNGVDTSLFERVCMSDSLYAEFRNFDPNEAIYVNFNELPLLPGQLPPLEMVRDASHGVNVRGWVDTFDYKMVVGISTEHLHHYKTRSTTENGTTPTAY